MNSTMTDYGFYTEQEIKELADSDLSFEIADAALLKTEADEYRICLLLMKLTAIMNKFPEEILQMSGKVFRTD
jgi:hypothetical protein